MRSISLATKFSLAIALLVTVALGIMSLLAVTLTRSSFREQALSAKLTAVTLAAKAVEQYVADAANVMREAVGRPKLSQEIRKANWREAAIVLENFLRHFPQFDYVFVQDPQGVIRVRVPYAETVGQDFSFRDFYQQVMRTRGMYISGVYVSRAAQRPVVSIAVPVLDGDRSVKGVLVGALSLRTLSQYISVIRHEDRSLTYLVDGKGLLVAHSGGTGVEPAQDMTAQPIVRAVLAGQSGTMEFRDPEGDASLLGAYVPIPRLGWGVVAAQPVSAAYAAANRLGWWLISIALGCAAAGVLLAWGLSRKLTGPLLRFAEATEKLGAGDFAVRVVPEGQDEVAVLAASFNSMVEQLQKSYRNLEGEINERKRAEERLQQQLSRLNLLNQITRAIGERQDMESIVRVTVQHLEDHLPVDYGCTCLLNPQADTLSVLAGGVKARPLVDTLGLHEGTTIAVSQAGLREFLAGRTIYVSDSTQSAVPFMRKFAEAGLRSVATASVFVESRVSGLLVVARRDPEGFSSGDCEFLRMLGEHLGLAIHQGQLYTQLQRAYEDLRQTQQVVLQQERLRALGQMASGIAHDINNALSPAALYVESLLEQEAGLSGRAREYLTTIQQALGDVAHTIGRMREFYRPRESQVTLLPVRLTQVVEQVAELTRPRWRDLPQQRGIVIDLRTDLPADLPPILGIESDLRDACTNLIFNAVDAMPQGGTLTLRVRPISNVERRISTLPTPDPRSPAAVVIEVSDTGVGMDEETRRRCLEPFFTTKGERGTGLGLAMVYGTLQRHGGEIAMESAVGRGTTVRLIFPTRAEAAEGARPAAEETPRRNLNLLVVDDDPMLRQSLKNILEADSHAVSVADGGQAGIQAFLEAQASAAPFDVVITDLGMPQVGGREVARAVKAASASTPVILLTGWGARMTAENDIPAQVDWVLGKPPKLRELREALAAVTD